MNTIVNTEQVIEKDVPTEERPCPHMRPLISPLADGTLSGPLRWYARFHVPRCRRCAPVLAAMLSLCTRLAAFGEIPAKDNPHGNGDKLTADRHIALIVDLDAIDRQHTA